MIAIVSMPAMRLKPLKSISTKRIIPKMPYTMDGMPARVSAAILTTATNLLAEEVYSVRNIAAATPTGTAMSRDIPAMMRVLKNAGMSDRFSLSYSSSKSDALRLGAPCMMTWMTIHSGESGQDDQHHHDERKRMPLVFREFFPEGGLVDKGSALQIAGRQRGEFLFEESRRTFHFALPFLRIAAMNRFMNRMKTNSTAAVAMSAPR